METLIKAYWSCDPDPQSCGGILPLEPPDAAGSSKYVFKISGRQRLTLAYFNRPKIKRLLKPTQRNSAPSGGRMHARQPARIRLLLQFSALVAALPNHPSSKSNCSLPARRAATTRPRYEVLGHSEASEHKHGGALGPVFVSDLRGAAASVLSRWNACCALTAGSRGFTWANKGGGRNSLFFSDGVLYLSIMTFFFLPISVCSNVAIQSWRTPECRSTARPPPRPRLLPRIFSFSITGGNDVRLVQRAAFPLRARS